MNEEKNKGETKDSKQNGRLVKCPVCEEKLPKSEAIQHTNKRYYHKECFDGMKKGSSDYKELIEYVCELHGLKKPTGLIMMQIKRFKEDLGYTYKGMELTLRYFHEVLDNKVDNQKGVGIIPYVYEDATRQYVQKMNVVKSAQEQDNLKAQELIFYIDNKKRSNNKKLIDIDSI